MFDTLFFKSSIDYCQTYFLVGFDGTLHVNMKEGEGDIHLSKIHKDSIITVEERSPFLIRLSETVMDNTQVEADVKSISVSKAVEMIKKTESNFTILEPKSNKFASRLVVSCKTSHVAVEKASWADMIKLRNLVF